MRVPWCSHCLLHEVNTLAKRVQLTGLPFVLPAVIMLMLIAFVPTIYSLMMSVLDIRGWRVQGSSFVGLRNYVLVFQDSIFIGALWFSARYMITAVIVQLAVGTVLAYLCFLVGEQRPRLANVLALFVMLPVLLPQVATATIFKLILNDTIGLIPALLRNMGISFSVTSNATSAFFALVLVDSWQWTPFIFLLMFAGMRMVPGEVLEAARVEGAGAVRQLFSILLPMCGYMTTVAVVLRSIWLFRAYEVPHIVTAGGPGTFTRTVSMQIFQFAFREGRLGSGAAATFIVFVSVNIAVAFYYSIVKRRTETRRAT